MCIIQVNLYQIITKYYKILRFSWICYPGYFQCNFAHTRRLMDEEGASAPFIHSTNYLRIQRLLFLILILILLIILVLLQKYALLVLLYLGLCSTSAPLKEKSVTWVSVPFPNSPLITATTVLLLQLWKLISVASHLLVWILESGRDSERDLSSGILKKHP